jgi:hypothetical protein
MEFVKRGGLAFKDREPAFDFTRPAAGFGINCGEVSFCGLTCCRLTLAMHSLGLS